MRGVRAGAARSVRWRGHQTGTTLRPCRACARVLGMKVRCWCFKVQLAPYSCSTGKMVQPTWPGLPSVRSSWLRGCERMAWASCWILLPKQLSLCWQAALRPAGVRMPSAGQPKHMADDGETLNLVSFPPFVLTVQQCCHAKRNIVAQRQVP